MHTKFGAAFLVLALAVASVMRPAAADQGAQTRNIILGAAAVIGIATLANVQHKKAVANSVVGYTPDGATVYQDGHIVNADGQSYYPSKYGQSVACSGQSCTISGNGQYDPYGGTGYNNNGYNNGYNNNGYSNSNNGYNGYNNTGYNGYNNNGTPYANTVPAGYNQYGGYPRDQQRRTAYGR